MQRLEASQLCAVLDEWRWMWAVGLVGGYGVLEQSIGDILVVS